mgnify:FL=1
MDFSCEQLEMIYEEFKASDLPSHRSIAIIAWNRMNLSANDEKNESVKDKESYLLNDVTMETINEMLRDYKGLLDF